MKQSTRKLTNRVRTSIADYLLSEQGKNWCGDTVEEFVDKLNGLIKTDGEIDEKYEKSMGSSYPNVKCAKQGCKFKIKKPQKKW